MQFITLLDYFLLPFYLVIIYVIARNFRDSHYPVGHPWRPYFMSGLTAKILGAIGIGLIYQYYYGGGDTALYHYHSSILWEALGDSFGKWVNLILHIPNWYDGHYSMYISRLEWYQSHAEYAVVVITSLLGLLTLNTFLPTSVLFGVIAFTGMWALFRTFATKYPFFVKYIAICTLFIPSTIMWGSGIFKDTICMFGLGWMTYGAFRLLINRDFRTKTIIMTLLCFYLVATIKIYILVAFIPAITLWILLMYSHKISNPVIRFGLKIVVIAGSVGMFLASSSQLSGTLGKYSLENVAKTSYITSTYIASVSGDQGSAYDLGITPSMTGIISKFPAAVNVTLFRPYIWETRKVIQMLNAIEAFLFMWVTIKVILSLGPKLVWKTISQDPTIQFCLIFTLIFAFAVGISSGNFGTLSRYRIPCLPFYGIALVLMYYKYNPIQKNILSFRL